MNMNPAQMGRRPIEIIKRQYNEQPVAPHMQAAWDVMRVKYRTRMAAAASMDVCTAYISQILRGKKPMPRWMREELGID